jgi:hypothetical protein
VILVGEKILANNTTANFNELSQYLSTLDIQVSCRFLAYTSVNEVQSMSEQSLILPVSSDKITLEISKIIQKKTDQKFLTMLFRIPSMRQSDGFRILLIDSGSR